MDNQQQMNTEPEVQVEEPAVKGKKNKKDKPKKPLWREILEWIGTLALAVVIAFAVRFFFFEPVKVDGRSMDATLKNGEIMLVTKMEYHLGDPERFDVVICHYPDRGKVNFVKRVVGLPGDTVEMKDGYLYVNGIKYEEEYLVHRPDYRYIYDGMTSYTVPEGMYFVLGDNRSNSNDSHIIGPISRKMIKGKVQYVFFPFDQIREIN